MSERSNSFGGLSKRRLSDHQPPSLLSRASSAVHVTMVRIFTAIASVATAHPLWMIGGALLLTCVLALGGIRFEEELDGTKLFAPRDSRAVEEDEWVIRTFGSEVRNTRIYYATDTGNVLTAAHVRNLHQLWQDVSQNVATSADASAQTYNTTCARTKQRPPLGSCPPSLELQPCRKPVGVLSLWDFSSAKIAALTDADVVAAVNNESMWRLHVPTGAPLRYYLSEVGLVEQAGRIIGARATRMSFSLKNERGDAYGGRPDDMESHNFELAVVDYIVDNVQPRMRRLGVRIDVQTTAEEEEAGGAAMDSDFAVLASGYIIMVFYACFTLSRARPKYSHATLGLVSVFSVGMSTISAYGLCWYIGLKFNTVVQVLILVLLGIGIDDTFVIMDSWWDNADETDMKQRMVKALAHAGPAITITSLTDLVAFLAGSSTKIPALRVFCYYACLGIFFDFVYQVTFFVAVAYLDSERQAAGRRDCCCCISAEDHDGFCGSCCGLVRAPRDGEAPYDEADRGCLHKVLGTYVPRYVVGTTIGKVLVLLLAALFLSLGAWGLTELKMNYNNEWFVPDDHRFREVMALRDEFWMGRSLPADVYVKQVDYPNAQFSLEQQLRDLEASRWVVKGSTASWLRAFQRWVSEAHAGAMVDERGMRIVRPDLFYPLLREYVSASGPLSAQQQAGNIMWTTACPTDPQSEIRATRMEFTIVAGPLTNGQEAVDCMADLRAVLDIYGSFPYSFVFIFWESYGVFIPEVVQNVSIAAACVFVLVTVLAANLFIGLYVIAALACVDTCLLGYMPWLGVELNGVSVICVVLAIGLAVDYSVHIAEAFLTRRAEDTDAHSARAQRAAFALWKMGPAVMNGGFSTFLAVAPLIFAVSYVFKVFFRMFFLIIFFGLFFGVLVLPVVLALCGPSPNPSAEVLLPHENPLHADFGRAHRCITPTKPVAVEMADNPDMKDTQPKVGQDQA